MLHENKNEKSARQNEKQNQKQTLHENKNEKQNQKQTLHENKNEKSARQNENKNPKQKCCMKTKIQTANKSSCSMNNQKCQPKSQNFLSQEVKNSKSLM